MASEKRFEEQIKKFLQSEEIYPLGTPPHKMAVEPVGFWEKRWGSAFTKSGLPDLSISVYGMTVEVEIKAENGKPSELQKFMVRQMQATCVPAMILYPDGFEDFKKFIRLYKKLNEARSRILWYQVHADYKNLCERGSDNGSVQPFTN